MIDLETGIMDLESKRIQWIDSLKGFTPGFFFREKKLLRTSDRYMKWMAFCCEHEDEDIDKYYQFGYEAFGAILLGFCEWLIKDIKRQDINEIVFFSRDGYIIKEAFELLSASDVFNTKYVYVSRRSLRVPLLWKYGEPSLKAIFPTKYISIQDLFESIGLDGNIYIDRIRYCGFELDSVCRDEEIETNPKLVKLLKSVWGDVILNSKKEFESAKEYFEEVGLGSRVAVVDIGWRGSMQHYLSELLNEAGLSIQMRGYYITLSSSMLRGQDMHGYLLDVDDKSGGCDIHRGYVGLLETLFLKTEGSVWRYGNNVKAKPLLYPYEYEKNGQYTKEVNAVNSIQAGALQFIKDYNENKGKFLENMDSIFIFSNLHRFATNPNLQDLAMFEDFKFYNGTVSYLAKAKPIYEYMLNPKELVKDFYGARWRIGFLKSMLKICLPYNNLFNMIMRYVKS